MKKKNISVHIKEEIGSSSYQLKNVLKTNLYWRKINVNHSMHSQKITEPLPATVRQNRRTNKTLMTTSCVVLVLWQKTPNCSGFYTALRQVSPLEFVPVILTLHLYSLRSSKVKGKIFDHSGRRHIWGFVLLWVPLQNKFFHDLLTGGVVN